MRKKLLLLCSKGFPGSSKVLINLKSILSNYFDVQLIYLEQLLLVRSPLPKNKGQRMLNFLQTNFHLLNIKHLLDYGSNILFAGWGTMYEIVLKKLNNNGIKPSLIMCSTPGQAELSKGELYLYNNIITHFKKGNIKYWLLNKRLFDSMGKLVKRTTYFPHTIDLTQFRKVIPNFLIGSNLDLFCPVRPGKNIVNQIIAFKLSNVTAKLHVNFSDIAMKTLLKALNIQVINHGWIDDSQYYNLIAAMKLSLQATFTESFNYAVAERMCLGVPVITSYDIYLTSNNAFLAKYLCVKRLDTPLEISDRINKIIKNNTLQKELSACCRKVIKQIALRNNRKVISFMRNNF